MTNEKTEEKYREKMNLREKLFFGGMATFFAGYFGFMGGIYLANESHYEEYLNNAKRGIEQRIDERELENQRRMYNLGSNIASISMGVGLPAGFIGWLAGLSTLSEEDKKRRLSKKVK